MQPINRKFRLNILVVLIALVLISCSSASEHQGPPIGLAVSNAESTDVTVLIKVTEVEKLQIEGGYTTSAIKATVEQPFAGDIPKGASIQYKRTVESNFEATSVNKRYIASFNRESGDFILPAEGYHFPYSSELAEALAAELADED